jgi:hypothetical protein
MPHASKNAMAMAARAKSMPARISIDVMPHLSEERRSGRNEGFTPQTYAAGVARQGRRIQIHSTVIAAFVPSAQSTRRVMGFGIHVPVAPER